MMFWLLIPLFCISEADQGSNNWISKFRARIEHNTTRFRYGFKFEILCSSGIAAYSTSVGYWSCNSSSDCPTGHSCSPSKRNTNVCCPTQELCPDGCPISDTNGIKLCYDIEDCPQQVTCQKDSDKAGVCCIDTSACVNGAMQIEGLNPYPVLKDCIEEEDCENTHLCTSLSPNVKGICCPASSGLLSSDSHKLLKKLLKQNEEKIERRKNMRRDVSYLIPLVGTPLAIVLVACAFHIKNEIRRYKRNREVDQWLASRTKVARPSAECSVAQFRYKGVLRIHGDIGDVKHALDDESSRSLKSIGFDDKHNEVVVIGSVVEQIDLPPDGDEISERHSKESENSVEATSTEKTAAMGKLSRQTKFLSSLEKKLVQIKAPSEKSSKSLTLVTPTGSSLDVSAENSTKTAPDVSHKTSSQSLKSGVDAPESSGNQQTSSGLSTPKNSEKGRRPATTSEIHGASIPAKKETSKDVSVRQQKSYPSEKIKALMKSPSASGESEKEHVPTNVSTAPQPAPINESMAVKRK